VVFLGAPGAADDVAARVAKRRTTSTDVRVPLGAPAGPVAVLTRAGAQSAPSAAMLAPAVAPARLGATPAVELAVRTPRAFYAAAEPAGLTYVLHAAAPAPVGIDLVRLADGVVVGHWDAPAVPPEVPQVITWDGTSAGLVQPAGRYAFRPTVGAVAGAARVEPPGQAAFAFATDRFPIVGPHRFGTGAAAFGGARHHQGQDTFAACGTPLVAAHGGVAKHAGWQSAAGNYLVIDNAGSGTDYVYMHLRAAALVSKGQPVLTGQPIGFVGDTGDADGCHLHFEIWTAPGWYTGGHPIDPLPFLEAWDG
jgi:murein DD-endopeptidase MepM/ murein hydrolase activator NlpD